jgi:hypothetical protein
MKNTSLLEDLIKEDMINLGLNPNTQEDILKYWDAKLPDPVEEDTNARRDLH